MSATFDPTLSAAKDRVRSALGDIDMSEGGANALRSDEAIAAVIAANGEALGTAVLAEGLAAEYAQLPDSISDSGTSLTWRERVKWWRDLAARIRGDLAAAAVVTTSGFVAIAPQAWGDEIQAEYVRFARWFD